MSRLNYGAGKLTKIAKNTELEIRRIFDTHLYVGPSRSFSKGQLSLPPDLHKAALCITHWPYLDRRAGESSEGL